MNHKLEEWLSENNIVYSLTEHPAVFTVDQVKQLCNDLPGKHLKNLFVRDTRTDQHYLITIPSEKRLDLNNFRRMIGARKIRFGSPEKLMEYLGLTAGSVSPLGLVNDLHNNVEFIVDQDVWNAKSVSIHPNINTASIEVEQDVFHTIIAKAGHLAKVMILPYLI
ncbi:MAG: prolyl-tRNA synthetase associated domain-containing protein [Promethearchaeota archaeon]